ncbi:uncharacterized protein [Euphorbia lathyris]|uniref:uncharacterized protein n=1 Tax=Euphorbia lathyris TaxID=212925 RepID=UPI0033138FAE
MGNSLTSSSSCFKNTRSNKVILIFFEGATTTLTGNKKHIAGEIMFENPDKMVCDADSFYIGQPLPALSIDDHLSPGNTYFVLPIDKFSTDSVLSATSFSAFSSNSNSPVRFGDCPFQYVKGNNGRVLIKVLPEFIIGLMNRDRDHKQEDHFNGVCSTPELKKHYHQLVRSKDHSWSPKLHTISERKIRYSPCKLFTLDWKQKDL